MDPDYEEPINCSDTSDEDDFDTENETVVLKAVNTIIKRSLKRTRKSSRIPKAKRMKVVRDRRQGRQVIDKDVSIAKSRYNVIYLLQVMKDFDDDQRQFVRAIDFGAILDLDGGNVPWSFVQWLADHVDVTNEKMIFQQKSIEISADSFGHVLGIPSQEIPVPAENKGATAEFLHSFGLTEMPSIKFFGDKVMKKNKSREDFLRCFITVAFATFYCPTSSTKPSTSYLGGILDVDNIKSYNWAKFMQQWSLFYIKKYLTNSSTLAVCNYYIAVRYLYFLDFASVQIQPTLPRVSVWKGDMIKEYIKLDMDDDNYYGKLPIKDIMETCYGQVTLINKTSNGYSTEQLRKSLDAIQHCTIDEKARDSICSLFEDYTKEERIENCYKVEQLLVKTVECLLQKPYTVNNSQSTEKIVCSSQDENKSAGSTLKLPSHDDNADTNLGNSDGYCGSQQSNNSVTFAKPNKPQSRLKNKSPLVENTSLQDKSKIASTNQIIARLTEPRDDNCDNGNKTTIHSNQVADKDSSDERIYHVNNALCKLNIKERMQNLIIPCNENKPEMKEQTEPNQSCGNSASLQHMLNEDQDSGAEHFSMHKTQGSQQEEKQEADEFIITEFTTPRQRHPMFSEVDNAGKTHPDSTLDKSPTTCYLNSSSIQCAQRTNIVDNQTNPRLNLINKFSTQSNMNELSSATRIQSYTSAAGDGNIGDMSLFDFEVDDGIPSVPYMERWLASPRVQAIRSMRDRELAAEIFLDVEHAEMQKTPAEKEMIHAPPSPERNNSFGSPRSPPAVISIGSPTTPTRKGENDIITIASQDSPEVVFLKEKNASVSTSSDNNDEVVYIGEHRLSPIKRKISEAIDMMYDHSNTSNHLTSVMPSSSVFTTALPPRRVVPASKYISSPYDANKHTFAPTPKDIQYYQAIVRLANLEEFRHKMAIQIGNYKVSFETFGNSLKPGGVVEAWVINLYCRILFKKNDPKESNRHTFFHTSSEYFLEKWENEERRTYLKDQTIKAFDGAGKAKKLHLTDLLHFPSLYNYHWFLFTVDIRDKKFMFMDSLFDKDSSFHKEVDDKMMKNFKEIWVESGLKKVDFENFEVLYPKVPRQINGKDCGFFVMKNFEYFQPRNSLMGTYSVKDIPNIRIQIANEMMFCQYNEMDEMQEAVRAFKPAVHGRYARMM